MSDDKTDWPQDDKRLLKVDYMILTMTTTVTRNFLGYTSVHTTDIYANVLMEKKADAVNLTNGLFGSGKKQRNWKIR